VRHSAAVPVGAATLALLTAACALAWQTDSPLVPLRGGTVDGTAPWFLALVLGAFATYVIALAVLRKQPTSARAVIFVAAAIQFVPVAAPLEFPDNPALPWMGSAWVDTTTVYGPTFTIASEPLAIVAGDSEEIAAWTFKALAALAMLAAAILAGRLSQRSAFAIAFVGWNPLLALHAGGGGHNDAWVGALILAALALSASRRLQLAGVMWVLAITIKWVPILFLALRAVEARATGRHTGHRGFALAALAVATVATVLYGPAWPLAIFPLAGNVALETSYAIPHRLEQLGLPDSLALGLAVAAFATGFAWLLREASRGRARLGLAACLVLVTTPYLAVWYLAWAVPLAAADDDPPALAACVVLCLYLLPQAIPV